VRPDGGDGVERARLILDHLLGRAERESVVALRASRSEPERDVPPTPGG
jgi:hypothetical protein